jgi:RimJ/RimL family protein N-acetyltransferase
MNGLPRRAWRRIQRDGALETAKVILDALTLRIWRVYELVETPASAPADIEIQGLSELRQRRGPGLPGEFYLDQRGAGRVYAAFIDNRPAGVLWVLEQSFPSRYIKLSPGQAELGYAYVLPEFRGRKVMQQLIRAASTNLLANGYQRIFAVVEERNRASERAFLATGFRQVGQMWRATHYGPRYSTAW